jgi:hypothetical protein
MSNASIRRTRSGADISPSSSSSSNKGIWERNHASTAIPSFQEKIIQKTRVVSATSPREAKPFKTAVIRDLFLRRSGVNANPY